MVLFCNSTNKLLILKLTLTFQIFCIRFGQISLAVWSLSFSASAFEILGTPLLFLGWGSKHPKTQNSPLQHDIMKFCFLNSFSELTLSTFYGSKEASRKPDTSECYQFILFLKKSNERINN